MERRLKNYLAFLAQLDLGTFRREDLEEMQKECLVQIGFFQHERLVHLMVTVVFAIMTLLSMLSFFLSSSPLFILLTGLFVVLLIPYVRHYYILENGVQTMYAYYDRMAVAGARDERIVPTELYSKRKQA
ncbi:MAG: hypothetical protein K6F35_01155 [Lachnospiraceae bacterium]|nr:hypothetical protein [Lachnospiraceae bacterium]